MKNINRKMLLLLMTLITGCATQGSLDTVHKEIDTISPRVYTTEKELGSVRQEFSDRLSVLEKNYKSDIADLRKNEANTQANIDNTRLDMQTQNGKLDDLSQAVQKPIEELQRYRDDTDKRIVALEDSIVKLQAAVGDLNKKMSGIGQQQEVAQTPESQFLQGMDTFKAGDMPSARKIFQNFLELFPHHELAAKAIFLIAESYYNEKNYDQAILKYQDVIKNYPQNENVPAAMLKQGISFKAIKDVQSAKFVLKKLTKNFPKSAEAKEARDLLKKIR